MTGKTKSAQARTTHGYYRTVLTGADAVNFDAGKPFTESEMLREFGRVIHARVRRIQEGDVRLGKEANAVKQALEILVEQEQISDSFAKDLIAQMAGFNFDRQIRAITQAANLANQAIGLDRMGELKERARILQEFFFFTMQSSGERHVKEQGIAVLQLLKTEAGIDTEALAEMQARLLSGDEEESFDDQEGGAGDEESVDVAAEAVEE